MPVVHPDTTQSTGAIAVRQALWGVCRKCNGRATVNHHKGCDKYLSRFNNWIKNNYEKWLDCVRLCDRCHSEIHAVYALYFPVFTHNTPDKATSMRTFFIKRCNWWLSDNKSKAPQLPTPPPTTGSPGEKV